MAANNLAKAPVAVHWLRRPVIVPILACIAIFALSIGPAYLGAHWLQQSGLWTSAMRPAFEILPHILCLPALLLACLILRAPVWPCLALELQSSEAERRRLASNIVLAVVLLFAAKAAIFLSIQITYPQVVMKVLTELPAPPTEYMWWTLVIATAILTPIIEEIVFRGFLMNRLSAASLDIASSVRISAVLFGLLHFGDGVASVIFAMLAGAFLGRVRVKTGSTVPGIVLHAAWNASTLMCYGLAITMK